MSADLKTQVRNYTEDFVSTVDPVGLEEILAIPSVDVPAPAETAPAGWQSIATKAALAIAAIAAAIATMRETNAAQAHRFPRRLRHLVSSRAYTSDALQASFMSCGGTIRLTPGTSHDHTAAAVEKRRSVFPKERTFW